MNKFFISIAFFAISFCSFSQSKVPYFGNIKWINGYAKEISGETLSYYSAFPDYVTTSLLSRTTDGQKTIEWETAPVPAESKEPFIYFSWVAAHSTGTSGGNRNFDLYVNDQKLLTFTTEPKNQNPNWKFTAPDSSALVFQQTKMDANKDAHGLAYLRLPHSCITPGKPVRLKVVGQHQNSNDWYMTFKFSFEEKVDIQAMPFLLNNGKQPIVFTALHFGKPQQVQINLNEKENYVFTIKEGISNFEIPVAAVQKKDSILVKISSEGKLLSKKYIVLNPVVNRTFYFIHHSHTDIGYSHLQPEVVKIHNKNIDDALQMIDATKNYPEEAKFRWNVESLWAVENFLKQAGEEQKEKLIAAVNNGSIGLSALYANMLTGMSQPEEMFHYTDYALQLKKQYGLKINSAMISDIPGFAWTTVTALAKGGVRYFSSGPNYLGENHPFWGDRVGYFVKAWGDKPVWWTSPSGEEKILFWTGGKGYSSWHGTAPGAVFERGAKKIAEYMNELSTKNYPYDLVQWRYNVVADNGPIDTSISRFVKAWNEKYASPKIILSTTEKMFADFEKKYGQQIPVVKGDITPYWEDGAQSTAEEEGRNRVNSLRLQQLTTLYSMLNPNQYHDQKFYEAWKNIILFHEHTWGAHNSISQPDIPFVTEQWHIKKQFLLEADSIINQLENELFQSIKDNASKTIAVFNTTSYIGKGPVYLPSGVNGASVKDANGTYHPIQKLSDGRLVFMAKNIPPLGKAVYELTDKVVNATNHFVLDDSSIANDKISFAWSPKDGSIISLQKKTRFNYAGTYRQQGLNSYWYVPGFDPADAVSNDKVKVSIAEQGPVLTSIKIQSSAPGTNDLDRRISLFAGEEQVILENRLDKKAIRTKEAVHFGFPFNDTLQTTTLDAGYGSMKYLADQLPGSNFDYLYGRRWIDVSNDNIGVQLMLLQTPLVEPGAMIDERLSIHHSYKDWKKEGNKTSTWFSYVMNNYWHTNFKIDQNGKSIYQYALRPHGMVNNADMEKAATRFTQPLIALPVKLNSIKPGSLFELSNSRITVTSITPSADGSFLVRLFNPEPTTMKTQINWKEIKPRQMRMGENIKSMSPDENIKIPGMGVMELKLIL